MQSCGANKAKRAWTFYMQIYWSTCSEFWQATASQWRNWSFCSAQWKPSKENGWVQVPSLHASFTNGKAHLSISNRINFTSHSQDIRPNSSTCCARCLKETDLMFSSVFLAEKDRWVRPISINLHLEQYCFYLGFTFLLCSLNYSFVCSLLFVFFAISFFVGTFLRVFFFFTFSSLFSNRH